MSFLVGDRVRRIRLEHLGGVPVGTEFLVVHVNIDGYVQDGDVLLHSPEFLELVSRSAPTARSNDPAASKGKKRVNKYEQAVLDSLGVPIQQTGPGTMQGVSPVSRTGKEIAALTGHPLNCITPRFAPLRRKGLIRDSGSRRDKQIVWMLA